MSRLLKVILLTVVISGGLVAGIFFFITPDYSATPEPPSKEQVAKMHNLISKKDCSSYTRGSTDGPEGLDQLAIEVSYNALNEYNYLETIINRWNGKERGQEKCLLDDGRPYITAIWAGYNRELNSNSDERWQKKLKEIVALHQQYPRSASIALLRAEYWKSYAWYVRGSGFSSTVTDDGYRLFKERMKKAEQVLIESKPYATSLPLWYSQMVEVQNILGRSPKEIDQTFLDGVNKDKLYYPLYFTMLNFNLPKWKGTWGTVENLINWSVKNTKETEGYAMYARMYWAVNGGLLEGKSLFKDTYAEWPKMKKGFDDMMERYPKSNWNLNNYAKFACMANDKETFLELRTKINHSIHQGAWYGNPNLDICEIKFGYEE